VSILVHVALVLLAFVLVWQTLVPQDDAQTTVPTLRNAPEVLAPSAMANPSEPIAAPTPRIQPVVSPVRPLMPGFDQAQAEPVVRDFQLTCILPEVRLTPDAVAKGGPDFFDIPGLMGPPVGPPTEPGRPAKRFVYLIDASGSMVDVLPFVMSELKKTLPQHTPDQRVAVLIFSGTGVHELPGGKGLREMTAEQMERFRVWLTLDNHGFETGGRGSSYVRQALTQGLGYKPDVMFLLSDNLTGGGQGATRHEIFQDDLLGLIADHNRSAPRATIHTVQFLYDDPLVRHGMVGTLERIAKDYGGKYRFITQRELNLR